MPELSVGARGEGAISALLDLVQERKQRRQDQEDKFRQFRQSLIESGVKGQIRGFEANPEFIESLVSGQSFGGSPLQQSQAQEIDSSNLNPGETVMLGQDGQVIRRTLSGPQVQNTELQTLQELISSVSQAQPQEPSRLNRLATAGADKISDLLGGGRREQLLDLAQTAIGSGALGPLSAPLGAIANRLQAQQQQSIDPVTLSVIEDIQSGEATLEEFLDNEAELQDQGVDTQLIRKQLGL